MTWTSETIMRTIQRHMLNECITNAKLVQMTGMTEKQVESATQNLHKNGFIKRIEPGCYRMTQAGITALDANQNLRSGPKCSGQAPKQHKDSVRVRVWRAIRIRNNFAIEDLIPLVTKGEEKDPTSNIRKYITVLECAGYLIRLPKRKQGTSLTSNGYLRWRLDLECNTGPQAPIWRQQLGTLFDPNTGKEIPLLPLKQGDE